MLFVSPDPGATTMLRMKRASRIKPEADMLCCLMAYAVER